MVKLYYHHSFLNTCYLLKGLRKPKESAFKLNKSRVAERRHLGDIYVIPYGAKVSRRTIFADFAGGFLTEKIALCETWLLHVYS